MSYCPLRSAMIEIAPRVEELSGLRVPRRYGHLVHPRIKWVTEVWHNKFYGFYRSGLGVSKTIYINANFAVSFKNPDLIKAVIAHEYVHYLQDLHLPRKEWNDLREIEKLAVRVENHFIPKEFEKIDIEEYLKDHDKKRK